MSCRAGRAVSDLVFLRVGPCRVELSYVSVRVVPNFPTCRYVSGTILAVRVILVFGELDPGMHDTYGPKRLPRPTGTEKTSTRRVPTRRKSRRDTGRHVGCRGLTWLVSARHDAAAFLQVFAHIGRCMCRDTNISIYLSRYTSIIE